MTFIQQQHKMFYVQQFQLLWHKYLLPLQPQESRLPLFVFHNPLTLFVKLEGYETDLGFYFTTV